MLNVDDFRDLALRLNGATEGSHMGHPDFRVKGKIFCTVPPDEDSPGEGPGGVRA